MPKRVLITGASGFIGANVARRALRDGHEVHVLLRPEHRNWRIADIADDLRIHTGDVCDADTAQAIVALSRPDWVFHLAAYGAYPNQTDLRRMTETNLMGLAVLLDACAKQGVGAFINAGSSSEYGFKNHAPGEDERLEPNSHYAITKAAGTHYTALISRTHDINAITLRLWSIYGPWEEPTRLIPTLIAHASQGTLPPLVAPETARDFVFIDDAVNAIMAAAAATKVDRGTIFNVCSGVQNTVRDVVEQVCRLTNLAASPQWGTLPPRQWDTNLWFGSAVAIERVVGWRALTPLRDGLKVTVEWFRNGGRAVPL